MMKIYSTYVKKNIYEDIYLTETEPQVSGVAAVNNWFRSSLTVAFFRRYGNVFEWA